MKTGTRLFTPLPLVFAYALTGSVQVYITVAFGGDMASMANCPTYGLLPGTPEFERASKFVNAEICMSNTSVLNKVSLTGQSYYAPQWSLRILTSIDASTNPVEILVDYGINFESSKPPPALNSSVSW